MRQVLSCKPRKVTTAGLPDLRIPPRWRARRAVAIQRPGVAGGQKLALRTSLPAVVNTTAGPEDRSSRLPVPASSGRGSDEAAPYQQAAAPCLLAAGAAAGRP